MLTAMTTVFYASALCYLAAAIVTMLYLRSGSDSSLRLLEMLLLAGAILIIATFVLRWAQWHLLPLTTMVDSLNLFVLMSTFIILFVVRRDNVPALLCYYVPPLSILAVLNAAVAWNHLATKPRDLPSIPLTLHVGLVFLAYSLFFLASMTSATYVCQSYRLKRRSTSGLFQKLPSLEQLEATLWRLVVYGYPLFVATLFLGFAWAWFARSQLEARWWLAPKVVLSVFMAVFYAATFHLRRSGRLRGPKLAYHIFVGFSVMLAAYVLLALFNLREYNFWGPSP